MSSPTLQQTPIVRGSRIVAIGASRGDIVVPNADVIEPINSSDEWIRQRTGIIERRYASPGRNVLDMSREASQEALAKAGVDGADVDLVIVATISNMMQTPSVAARLAGELGATPATAFDLSAGCAGYCYAIAQADAVIRAGSARTALVVGAEKLSELIDPTDRSISFLLGDGAGAAVLVASDDPGISRSLTGSDGTRWQAVAMNGELMQYRRGEIEWPTLRQDGPSVFRWAVWEMAKVARQMLEEAGITADDLAAFIPHQANMRIIDEFAKQLGLPEHVVVARDIANMGNTSAASIPLATHRLLEEHPECSGGLALQIGFGAGLVYGAQVVRLP